MKKLFLSFACILQVLILQGQVFTSSNLPIVRINTNGVAIPDEPKITATMQVIWQQNGGTNLVSDTNYHYNGKIGIEMRGSTSQSIFPKKPYAVELRNAAGLDSSFALLGMPKEADWAFIATYNDKTLMRDAVMYHFGNKIMDYAPRRRFVELIINNAYLGVYMVAEKIERGKDRVNVSKLAPTTRTGDSLTGGYILKIDKLTGASTGGTAFFSSRLSNNGAGNNKTPYLFHYPKPEDINAEQVNYIKNFIYNFEDVMASPTYNDSVNGYVKYINDSTFIDFWLLNEMARNVDGYRLSTYLYKDRNSVDPRLKMGPLWDFNIALGNADYCGGNLVSGWAFQFNQVCPTDFWLVPFWWQKLFDDARFRTKIKARWRALRSTELSNTKILSFIDSTSTLLNQAQARNFQRWPVLNTRVWPNPQASGSYTGEVTYLKNWLTDRLIWMDGEIDRFSASNTGGGVNFSNALFVSPNPSMQDFKFTYYLYVEEKISLQIFNLTGQLIEEQSVTQRDGERSLTWQPKNAAAGLYVYRLFRRGEIWKTGKIELIR